MPVLTRLTAGKRNPSRVNLYIDHKFAFSLSADQVLSQNLTKDQELTNKSLSQLRSLSAEEKLFTKILNYLSYRPRSRQEVELRLRKYLINHDDSAQVISGMLTRLDDLGYLDDLAFAQWFVESRGTHRPRSSRHLRSELLSKGISREVINSVISSSHDTQAIKKIILKKSHLSPDKLRTYLSRRGFSYSIITKTIDELELYQ